MKEETYAWRDKYLISGDGRRVAYHNGNGQNDDRVVAWWGDSTLGEFISIDAAVNAIEKYAKDYKGATVPITRPTTNTTTIPRKNMIKEITTDAKEFIHENRNVIYWLALAFLADHFFFAGAFRTRLNALVENMIGKVEKKLAETP